MDNIISSAIKHTGLTPQKNQIYAAELMEQGKAIEMRTGEGKTLSALITILYWLSDHKTVTYVTANEYLAKRDYDFMYSSITSLNKKPFLLDNANKIIDNADVIFTTIDTLSSYYLTCLIDIKEPYLTNNILIDEFDTVLIDKGSSAKVSKSLNYDPKIFKHVYAYVKEHDELLDMEYIDKALLELVFTKEDYYQNNFYIRDMILDCYKAKSYVKDIDYIVKDNDIRLLNSSNRTSNNVFSGFKQLYILKKENLPLNKILIDQLAISYEGLINKYRIKAGMSGTLLSETEFIKDHFGMDVVKVESEFKNRLKQYKDIIYRTDNELNQLLINFINNIKSNNPILLVCPSIDKSIEIYDLLKNKEIKRNIRLLNAKNSFEEAEIISKAGEESALTVTTPMAGRGTDIVIDEKYRDNGGLVIISLEHMNMKRLDDQLIGRAGRRGDEGTVIFFNKIEGEKQSSLLNKMESLINESNNNRFDKVLSNALLSKQSMLETDIKKSRDYISYFYQIIDAQIDCFRRLMEKLRGMSLDELKDLMSKDIYKNPLIFTMVEIDESFKDDLLEIIRDRMLGHYMILRRLMFDAGLIEFEKAESFISFQKLANEEYYQSMDKLKREFAKLLTKSDPAGKHK